MQIKHDYTHPLPVITVTLGPDEHNRLLDMLRHFIELPYACIPQAGDTSVNPRETAQLMLHALENA